MHMDKVRQNEYYKILENYEKLLYYIESNGINGEGLASAIKIKNYKKDETDI